MRFSVTTRQQLSRIVGLLISGAILFMLYRKLNLAAMATVIREINGLYLVFILFSFFLVQFLAALRWKLIAHPFCRLSLFESIEWTASSGSLNVLLPSKMGHLAKAYLLISRYRIDKRTAFSTVLYEKLSDLAAMSLVIIVATIIQSHFNALVLFSAGASLLILTLYIVTHFIDIFRYRLINRLRKIVFVDRIGYYVESAFLFQQNKATTPTRLLMINMLTGLLWTVHIIQTVMFFYMLGLNLSIITIISFMYCAIFIGLLPISIAGIGTRDAAIVYLFDGIISYSQAISIGILSTMRYFISAFIGFPFFLRIIFEIDHRQFKSELHPVKNSISD